MSVSSSNSVLASGESADEVRESHPALPDGVPASAALPAAVPGSSAALPDVLVIEASHENVENAEAANSERIIGAEYLERASQASLIRNFKAMLNDVDYREALEVLGVGTFQLSRRKRLKREFRALYVGLWRLALKRSLPGEYDAVFHAYMEQQMDVQKKREDAVPTELVLQYVDKLREYGDSDFSDVSRHMLSLLEFDESQTKGMILKLALHLRRVYKYFFDHLL